jgi:hypothetical protein
MPNDHCQPIRDDIATVQEEITALDDLLDEVPSGLKPSIQASIKGEKTHLMQLRRTLRIWSYNQKEWK